MAYRRFKPAFQVLLALLLVTAAHAQAPGECTAQGGTTAKCCEHEAFWCHGGNNRALAHCRNCHEECLKISKTSVCVQGGTWPHTSQKCYNGIEWFKVCLAIPNDKTLGGGAWNHVDRSTANPSTIASEKDIEELPGKLEIAIRAASRIAQNAKRVNKLSTSVKTRPNPISNQIAFVIGVMGQIVSALRSALTSNTIQDARRNLNSAVNSLDFLKGRASDLIDLIPQANKVTFDRAVGRWIGAVTIVKDTLEQAIGGDTTLADLKQSAQFALDELSKGFWTRAQVALDGYAAANTFTEAWGVWVAAIAEYFRS